MVMVSSSMSQAAEKQRARVLFLWVNYPATLLVVDKADQQLTLDLKYNPK